MLRNIMITGTAIGLSMSGNMARADHSEAVRYVVAGAVIGAALGELAYASDHRAPPRRAYVDYGDGWNRAAYVPRYYSRAGTFRGRPFDRHSGHRYGYRNDHRRHYGHGRRCR